jgi:cyclomaltodextrinase
MPKIGEQYRHFKGNHYEVVGFAFCSETKQKVIIYKDLRYEGKTWVRPLEMFIGIHPTGIKRFEKVISL